MVLVILLLFAAGIAAVLYPAVSNMLYERSQSHVTAQYDAAMEQLGRQALQTQWQAAQEYNRNLLKSEAFLTDPFDPALVLDPTVRPYADLLNAEGNGMMGYVQIPKIDVNLPIYHGTTAQVLAQGVGHLQNTSLPVGGTDSHTVLTGHTGFAGKRLFTDLSQLQEGDVFYLHILGNTLAYQVESIRIVEPDETAQLVVQRGRDLATLVTCHPYGINTHRLLVQGTRLPEEQAQQPLSQDVPRAQSVWKREYQKALFACLAVYVPLGAIAALILRRRKKRAGMR